MHAGLLVQDTRFVVKMSINAGLLRDSAHHRSHKEGQQGQLRLVRALPSVQPRPKLFERSDVDLLNVGYVRNARVGDCHLLGDLATQAYHLHVIHGSLRLIVWRPRRCGALSEKRIKVVVGDAPRWTGARDLAQVDPRFSGPQADRGRGQGTLPLQTGSAATASPWHGSSRGLRSGLRWRLAGVSRSMRRSWG